MAEPAPTQLTVAAVKHVRNYCATQWYLHTKAGEPEKAAPYDQVVEAIKAAFPEVAADTELFPEWPASHRQEAP